jgi:hypothetical protein
LEEQMRGMDGLNVALERAETLASEHRLHEDQRVSGFATMLLMSLSTVREHMASDPCDLQELAATLASTAAMVAALESAIDDREES